MIQRIQSIYLILIFICSCLIFFFPLASYLDYQFTILSLNPLANQVDKVVINTIPLIINNIVIGILSIITIFLFKKRPVQLKLTKLILLLDILFIILIFYYAGILEELINNKSSYTIGSYFPLAILLLAYLAGRSIKKDEELVKSADRLR